MAQSDRTLIYVDESSFNLFTRRTRGRAVRGRPAVRQLNFERGRNLNLCLAVAAEVGVVYFELQRGTMTKEKFGSFLYSLDAILEAQGASNCFIIMDNAPVHNDAESSVGTVKKLPPYSPFLYPIENCFSVLKTKLREELRLDAVQQRLMEVPTAVSITEHRLNVLHGITTDLLLDQVTLTSHKVNRMQNHVITYMDRCLNDRDIVC